LCQKETERVETLPNCLPGYVENEWGGIKPSRIRVENEREGLTLPVGIENMREGLGPSPFVSKPTERVQPSLVCFKKGQGGVIPSLFAKYMGEGEASPFSASHVRNVKITKENPGPTFSPALSFVFVSTSSSMGRWVVSTSGGGRIKVRQVVPVPHRYPQR